MPGAVWRVAEMMRAVLELVGRDGTGQWGASRVSDWGTVRASLGIGHVKH